MPGAESKLSEALDLVWDPQMQDWDLTNANPDLLHRLVGILTSPATSADECFSAMCLAVASYDELLLDRANDVTLWSSLTEQLIRHPELYASIVWYWAQPVVLGEEEPFPVSPAMEIIWKQVKDQLRSSTRADASRVS